MLNSTAILAAVIASSMFIGGGGPIDPDPPGIDTLAAAYYKPPAREDTFAGGGTLSSTVGLLKVNDRPPGHTGTCAGFNIGGNVRICTLPATDPGHTIGSEDFTMEFWAKGPAPSATAVFMGNSYASGLYRRWWFETNGSSTITFSFYSSLGNTITATYTVGSGAAWSTFWDSGWHHICAQRNGNVVTIYVDGVAGAATGAPATGEAVKSSSTMSFFFGCRAYSRGQNWTGYMDELRITKNVVRYPTAPFTRPATNHPRGLADAQWANVSLLLGFDDDFGHMPVGSAINLSYSAATSDGNGVSHIDSNGMRNNGTGAVYLNTGPDLDLGSGDFTFEIDVYVNGGSNAIRFSVVSPGTAVFQLSGASGGYELSVKDAAGADLFARNMAISDVGLHRLALVREGGSLRCYLNGALVQTAAIAGDIGPYTGKQIDLRANPGSSGVWLRAFRISKGARYSGSSYVPPDPALYMAVAPMVSAFSGTTNDGDDGTWSNYTSRTSIGRGMLPPSGTKFRVKIMGTSTTGGTTINKIYAGLGQNLLFTSAPVQLTFGGSTSVTLTAGQSAWSDPFELPYTGQERMIISAYHPAGASPNDKVPGISNVPRLALRGYDSGDAANTVPGSFSIPGFSQPYLIGEIVVEESGEFREVWPSNIAFTSQSGWSGYTMRTRFDPGAAAFTSTELRFVIGTTTTDAFVGYATPGTFEFDDTPTRLTFDGSNTTPGILATSDPVVLSDIATKPILVSVYSTTGTNPHLAVRNNVKSHYASGNSANTLGAWSGTAVGSDRIIGVLLIDCRI